MMNNLHAPQLPMTACYAPLSHGSLFSGIGGFDLAAEWVGWQNRFHCEWNEFGQKILKHYWPNAISYGDITQTDFTIHRGTIDVLTGGFPCQPYSLAGKRLGKEDERHLWPEMLRAIREIAPRYIVGENVAGLLSWNGGLVFNEVQTDLENEGYEVQPCLLPACAVNAPHKRERVWFIAHAQSDGGNRTSFETSCKIEGQDRHNFKQFTERGEIRNVANAMRSGLWKSERGGSTGAERESYGHDSKHAFSRAIANATCQQSERLQPEQREFSQQEQRQLGKTSGEMGYGDATNTRRGQWQNWLHGEEQGRQTAEFGNSYTKLGAWSQFPITEPTICGGNDGIPRELDGITFPKWRNESIKAFGNAIVPQVAYQIFKAIQLHDASLSGA